MLSDAIEKVSELFREYDAEIASRDIQIEKLTARIAELEAHAATSDDVATAVERGLAMLADVVRNEVGVDAVLLCRAGKGVVNSWSVAWPPENRIPAVESAATFKEVLALARQEQSPMSYEDICKREG